MSNKLWKKAVAFHGHECGGLAVGARACEAVLLCPGLREAGYGELFCVTENDACGVDAIQSLLGCSIGKGNLIYRDTGKQAYSFFNKDTGMALRIYLKASRPEDLPREEWQKILLELPLEEMFIFSQPGFAIPENPRLFTTIACDLCGEGAPEHKIRLQENKKICLDCYKTYDRGW